MDNRELDRLVAEKVMGYREHAVHHYWHNAASDEAYDTAAVGTYDFFWLHLGCPHYSSDMAAAWEVVEKLKCEGWDNKYFFLLEYDNVDTWDAAFYKQSKTDGGGAERWATADTPARAICLAALKAVGVEP